jgi:hypothetical protein
MLWRICLTCGGTEHNNILPLLHLLSAASMISILSVYLFPDDMNRVVTLSYDDVRRLDDSSASLRRGDLVLAVFPETTSFYRAVVVKTPTAGSGINEVVVKFEDDEDEAGRNPARRVPARFLMRRSDVEETNEESEDED